MLKNKINKSDEAVRHQVRDMCQKCLNNNTSHLIISQSSTTLVAFLDLGFAGEKNVTVSITIYPEVTPLNCLPLRCGDMKKSILSLNSRFSLHPLNLVEIERDVTHQKELYAIFVTNQACGSQHMSSILVKMYFKEKEKGSAVETCLCRLLKWGMKKKVPSQWLQVRI